MHPIAMPGAGLYARRVKIGAAILITPEMLIRSKLVPELTVTDLQESLAFWVTLLGFELAYARPEQGFAYLDRDGAQVMLEQCNPEDQWITGKLELPLGRGINFQIEVDRVEPVLERLRYSAWPLFEDCADAWYRAGDKEVGQRQFLVQDPDGYLLRLTESLGERPLGAAAGPRPAAVPGLPAGKPLTGSIEMACEQDP